MEESGVMSFMDCRVVASYNMVQSWWFTEGKLPIAVKVIAAFATANKWSGAGGMEDRRHEIKTLAETAGDCICMGIKDKLPQGGKLVQLAS